MLPRLHQDPGAPACACLPLCATAWLVKMRLVGLSLGCLSGPFVAGLCQQLVERIWVGSGCCWWRQRPQL